MNANSFNTEIIPVAKNAVASAEGILGTVAKVKAAQLELKAVVNAPAVDRIVDNFVEKLEQFEKSSTASLVESGETYIRHYENISASLE